MYDAARGSRTSIDRQGGAGAISSERERERERVLASAKASFPSETHTSATRASVISKGNPFSERVRRSSKEGQDLFKGIPLLSPEDIAMNMELVRTADSLRSESPLSSHHETASESSNQVNKTHTRESTTAEMITASRERERTREQMARPTGRDWEASSRAASVHSRHGPSHNSDQENTSRRNPHANSAISPEATHRTPSADSSSVQSVTVRTESGAGVEWDAEKGMGGRQAEDDANALEDGVGEEAGGELMRRRRRLAEELRELEDMEEDSGSACLSILPMRL